VQISHKSTDLYVKPSDFLLCAFKFEERIQDCAASRGCPRSFGDVLACAVPKHVEAGEKLKVDDFIVGELGAGARKERRGFVKLLNCRPERL
jgi:hypothetical protein